MRLHLKKWAKRREQCFSNRHTERFKVWKWVQHERESQLLLLLSIVSDVDRPFVSALRAFERNSTLPFTMHQICK